MAGAIGSFPLRRPDLRGIATRNIPLKLAAVGIALVAWLVLLQSQQVEEQTLKFEGRIPVERANVPEGFVLRGSLGTVEVTVRGPAPDLRELAVTSFRAEVDLSQYDVSRGELQELAVQVRVGREGVRVLDIAPSLVATKLVPVESKKMAVQVRLENQPPTGYQAETPAVAPAEVMVRGPADALREVVSVVVPVRFADNANDVQVAPRALPLDGAGHEVPDVEATPQNVEVSVAVRLAIPTRTVGVIPVVRGQPASGYWVASARPDPALVTLRGDQAALERVGHIETVTIDVAGASTDRLIRAALLLPPGISLARGEDAVQVAISVRPLTGTRRFPLVAVQPVGLRSDLVATLDPISLEVILTGTVPFLQALRAEQVTAIVELAGKGPDTYQLDAVVRAPAGTTMTLPGGARITVVVRSK